MGNALTFAQTNFPAHGLDCLGTVAFGHGFCAADVRGRGAAPAGQRNLSRTARVFVAGRGIVLDHQRCHGEKSCAGSVFFLESLHRKNQAGAALNRWLCAFTGQDCAWDHAPGGNGERCATPGSAGRQNLHPLSAAAGGAQQSADGGFKRSVGGHSGRTRQRSAHCRGRAGAPRRRAPGRGAAARPSGRTQDRLQRGRSGRWATHGARW